MSMFDWQASSDDSGGHRVMSKNFWIYWVVSLPLTALILVGWRFWWKNQRMHYAMQNLQVKARRPDRRYEQEKGR
jgi:hypothetical protein